MSVLKSLCEAASNYTESQAGAGPFATAIPGLTLLRSEHRDRANHHICKPALCIVLQGAKWTMFGETRVDYRAGQAMVVSVEMPAFSTIVEASPNEPYLGVIIELDLALMREVMEGLDLPLQPGGDVNRSVFVTDFEGPLAECALRLMRLLDTPRAIPVLSQSVMREICYWLLSGPHGAEIANLTVGKPHIRSVLSAIDFLRDRFAESVSIRELAAMARMSPSAFHRQFKSVTSMTPLQYQKQLRLLEARRVLAANEANVEAAATRVGYESSTQFSREYSRMFGMPPRRDMLTLRSAAI